MSDRAVLIRTDASADRGLGHLRRCLSLAAALEDHAIRSSFLVAGDGSLAQRHGYPAKTLHAASGSDEDLRETIEAAASAAAPAIIVDSYDIAEEFFAGIQASGRRAIAIDDRAAFPFAADLVVNGGVNADRLPYVAGSNRTEFLIGAQYALLSRAFRDIPAHTPAPRASQALLVLGGSDPHALTMPLLRELAAERDLDVTAVVGPLVRNLDEVVSAGRAIGPRVTVVQAPEDLAALMRASDMAVTAGGQTLYELAAAGVPCVVVVAADNQRAQCLRFSELGFSWIAGDADDPDIAIRTRTLVRKLMLDVDARAVSARAGQACVDGEGAWRVAERIGALLASR